VGARLLLVAGVHLVERLHVGEGLHLVERLYVGEGLHLGEGLYLGPECAVVVHLAAGRCADHPRLDRVVGA